MKIDILNKQRSLCLNLSWFKHWFNSLTAETLKNMSNKYPSHYPNSVLFRYENKLTTELVLVSNTQIQKINKSFRGKNMPTDVISFKHWDENDPLINILDNIVFGEIFLSVNQASTQSKNYGHSIEREFAFLFVHGLLHLFDFDHEEEEQKQQMFSLQEIILQSIGMTRDFIPVDKALLK